MDNNIVSKEKFIEKVQEFISNADGPFSIAVADIDNFESINKIYGYKIGDKVIEKLVSIFTQNLTGMDLVTRHGDEFNFLLVKKGAERSFMEMEEIRRYLSDNMFPLSDSNKIENVYITISCGIASYPRDAKNAVELFRVADSAMFRAKKLGKNRVCLSEAESMVLKSSYFTKTQVDRLAGLSKEKEKTEAFLLREALDDLFKKYSK
ncbi:diguanylate cyclase [Ruminiclostridium papyrosolvens DSM 2782]|uniref:Diguanylate cyclase n=1 Tax=Ruminiclostridium papyrosolvens DSM 2782 TaxID=588581 RepID=F1TDA5_9FIRM|nr:GGDEF domain-containing protein [Ruminiclostridium papyrosolvens]EGD47543.1 diguanylate cyclase [Ruminiclostridium papyrosolvens DSM 2782]WES36510.1 GGDEF domain-containing protein [Ruminiclostridium papyrosolvens DSM 2782]